MAGPVLDASTPAFVTIAGAATSSVTASFSPPRQSMLILFVGLHAADASSAQSCSSITNTGTALTWTLAKRHNATTGSIGGTAEIWWAWNAAAQSGITVTANYTRAAATGADQNAGLIALKVYTGTAASLATAATASDSSTTATAPTCSLTTTGMNSWVWGVCQNWNSVTIGTAGSNQTVVDSISATPGTDSAWVQKQNAATPNTATSVTINDTAPSIEHHLSAIEILAAQNPPPPRPSIQAAHRAANW